MKAAVITTILQGKCLKKVVQPSPYQPRRCVITQHNFGCGTTGSKNTLTKVQTIISCTISWLSTKLKASIFHSKIRLKHIKLCVHWRHSATSLILKNALTFGECSTICPIALLESVGSKMEPGVWMARTRWHPQEAHTMPSALMQLVSLTKKKECGSVKYLHSGESVGKAYDNHTICRVTNPASFRRWKQHLQGIWQCDPQS